jgi:O-antigen ligase
MVSNFLSKADSRIFGLLKWLLGFCLLTPLLMNASTIFPYTTPKAFVFRILVEAAAALYFYLCLKYPEFRPTFKKGGRGGFLIWSVLSFLSVNFLSAFFGSDFYLSWWGNLERMLGVWGLAHLVLLFLMLSSVFKIDSSAPLLKRGAGGDLKNQPFYIKLSMLSVGVSSIISLLAIGQRFFSLGNLLPQADRVFSTIGNPAFLGSYLLFNIFFVGYLIFSDSQERRPLVSRVAGSLILILLTSALILTGTRGAYLGFFAGAAICLFLFSFFSGNPKLRKYFWLILIVVALAISSLFIFRSSAFVQSNTFLSRLTSISLSDATAQSRLILWQGAWRAWQEKPIFGWGAENYEAAINKYFDARLLDQEAWFDRAHNFIFDYGVTGGWVGLLSYLALIGVAAAYLLKIIWRRRHGWGAAIFMMALLAAYLVQNFFVFDVLVSYLMLFLALAFIGFWHVESRSEGEKKPDKKVLPFGFWKKFLTVSFGLLAVLSIYHLNIKPWQAAVLGSKILSLPAEKFQEAAPLLQKALDLETFGLPEIVYQTSLDYIEKINSQSALAQNENFYKLSSEELTKIIAREPSQTRYRVALAWLNLYFSGRFPQRVDAALALGEEIKKMSPIKKDAYFILAAVFSLKNDLVAGEALVAEAQTVNELLGKEVQSYWQNLNQ